MKNFISLFLLVFSLWGQAQGFENPKTVELGIRPKVDDNQLEVKPLTQEKTPSLSDFKAEHLPQPDFIKPKGKSIFEKPQFQTPDFGIAQKINKNLSTEDRENMDEYKRNQYFGDFKTESKYIRLVYRDHLAFDGDRVQILLNDWIIARDILLESEYKSIHIDLKIGFNKVEIIALNQGTSGPNTAEFQVYDDQNKLISSNQWELATGFKGTIILSKEK